MDCAVCERILQIKQKSIFCQRIVQKFIKVKKLSIGVIYFKIYLLMGSFCL